MAEATSREYTHSLNTPTREDLHKQLNGIARYAIFMLSTASVLKELGYDYSEPLERYYDALACIARYLSGDYVDNVIIDAANKDYDVTVLLNHFSGKTLVNILTYLISDACNRETLLEITRELIHALSVREDSASRIESIVANSDCATAKRTILLLLATAPLQGSDDEQGFCPI